MNTARVEVLTIAVGAVCPASGTGSSGLLATEPAARVLDGARRHSDLLSPALNRIADLNIIQSRARDDQAYRRGDSINVTAQK